MKSRLLQLLAAMALLSGLLAGTMEPASASAKATSITCTSSVPIRCTGSFTDHFGRVARFTLQKPARWNGTLILYSHGLVPPTVSPQDPVNNPAADAPDPLTGGWLLAHGYALAGSSYSTTGWAVQQALDDQMDVLGIFAGVFSHPRQTIAWGQSLGGMITAGLVQLHPHAFVAALPMCGVLAGGVGTWNVGLDGTFAIKTLLAPVSTLQLVHITNPKANLELGMKIVTAAQRDARGRARLALAAALSDIPGWFNPARHEPAPADYAAQEQNQFAYLTGFPLALALAYRADVEARAGGNPSWNTGVNYSVQLLHSAERQEVIALYKQAGLSLHDDLARLNHAKRVAADPKAVHYLARYITFDGELHIPVLTMHTTGDGVVTVQHEQAYASVVRSEGNGALLRQVFVHRANHCSFTPAEMITAFQTLVQRMRTGKWDDSLNPAHLNHTAARLGSRYNVVSVQGSLIPSPPAFLTFHPTRFLRPFDRG